MSDIYIFSIHNPTLEERVNSVDDDVEEIKRDIAEIKDMIMNYINKKIEEIEERGRWVVVNRNRYR